MCNTLLAAGSLVWYHAVCNSAWPNKRHNRQTRDCHFLLTPYQLLATRSSERKWTLPLSRATFSQCHGHLPFGQVPDNKENRTKHGRLACHAALGRVYFPTFFCVSYTIHGDGAIWKTSISYSEREPEKVSIPFLLQYISKEIRPRERNYSLCIYQNPLKLHAIKTVHNTRAI